jgi:hypothetical protein
MRACKPMLYLLSQCSRGNSEAKMQTNSSETSGTFIYTLILGYLLITFVTTSLWKGYFPSRKREAGTLPSRENTFAAPAAKIIPLIFTQTSETEERSLKSLWEGHHTVLGTFVSKCYHRFYIPFLNRDLNISAVRSFSSFHGK